MQAPAQISQVLCAGTMSHTRSMRASMAGLLRRHNRQYRVRENDNDKNRMHSAATIYRAVGHIDSAN